MALKKTCGYCMGYFVNCNLEKLCVEKFMDAKGIKMFRILKRLGVYGDECKACENFKPTEGFLRHLEADKEERARKRAERKAAKDQNNV